MVLSVKGFGASAISKNLHEVCFLRKSRNRSCEESDDPRDAAKCISTMVFRQVSTFGLRQLITCFSTHQVLGSPYAVVVLQ